MYEINNKSVKIVMGDEDVIVESRQLKTLVLTNLNNREESVEINFKSKEDLRNIIDALNYMYISTHYKKEMAKARTKANKTIEKRKSND